MNIFCNDNGTILYVDPQKIYQNSAGVNTIRFIGRFPSSAQVLMAYQLPQGDWTMPKMLAFVKEIEGVQAPNGGNFSVWEGIIGASPKIDTETGKIMTDENGQVLYDLDYTITENYGTANLQFYVYASGGGQLATASTSIIIEKGVPMVLPDFDTDEAQKLLTQILSIVANTQELYGNVETELETLNTSVSANTADINALQTENATQGENIAQNSENIQELQEQVSENAADIGGLRADIQNEAHFRGYVQTNAEIQALKGTENDYAYSAESGTVWIYQNGAWKNSEKPVPDQMTPASNTTPLMDGVASVGSEGAYARGDHRHPTDTSRIGVNEKGQPNGIPTLNSEGKVPSEQLPPLDYLPITGGVVNGSVTANEFLINDADEVTAYQAHSIQEGLNTYQFRGKSGTLALLSDLEPIETTANLAMQILYQASIVYNPTTEDTYNERITAEGENVVDGSEAVLQKVVGSTVRCENLIPSSYIGMGLQRGITLTENDDGSITLNGEVTSSGSIYITKPFDAKAEQQYTYTADGIKTSGLTFMVAVCTADGATNINNYSNISATTKKQTFTFAQEYFDNGYKLFCKLYVTKGTVLNNETVYPMLNEGEEKPYQPYFTGLKSASFAGVESGGRNLILYPYAGIAKNGTVTRHGITYTDNGDGSITIVGTATEDGSYLVLLRNYDFGKAIDAINNEYATNGEYTVSKRLYYNDENKYLSINIDSGKTVNETLYPMLNHGSTALPYTPYIEPTIFDFPKTPTPMGTTIDFENKKIIEGSREIVLDGTEDWNAVSTNTANAKGFVLFLEETSFGVTTVNLISSVYDSITSNQIYMCKKGVGINTNRLAIYDENYSILKDGETFEDIRERFKAHLAELHASGNPVVVRYLLATPTEKDFTEEQKAVGKKYLVQAFGTESVRENDGKEYGADNTLTQDYIAIKE